jgi:hypothetical protein
LVEISASNISMHLKIKFFGELRELEENLCGWPLFLMGFGGKVK